MNVLTELRNRDTADGLISCCDGLKAVTLLMSSTPAARRRSDDTPVLRPHGHDNERPRDTAVSSRTRQMAS